MPTGSAGGSAPSGGGKAPNYSIYKTGANHYAYKASDGSTVGPLALNNLLTAIGVSPGLIEFRRDDYTLTAGVALAAGVVLDFMGSTLDVTAINGVVFNFHDVPTLAGWVHNISTGLCNLNVTGADANANTLLMKITQVDQGIVFHHINSRSVNNLFWVRGASYGDGISDILVYKCTGTFVRIEAFTESATAFQANAFRISRCTVSATSGGNYGVLIDTADATQPAEAVSISDSWFEGMNYCVTSGGFYTTIENTRLIAATTAIQFTATGAYGKVSGCNFTGQGTATGVDCGATGSTTRIVNNHFRNYVVESCIICSVLTYLIATGNVFQMTDAATLGITGNFDYSEIIGNAFLGATKGLGIKPTTATKTGNKIIGNHFDGCVKGITSALYTDNWTITGNTFTSCTTGIDIPDTRISKIFGNMFLSNGTDITAMNSTATANSYDDTLMGGTDSNLLANGTAEYFPVNGTKAKSTTELAHVLTISRPCYIMGLYVKLTAAPTGATKSYTISLRKNGATVTPAVTITDTATEGNWCGAYALAKGDRICMISNGGANTPTASQALVILELMFK